MSKKSQFQGHRGTSEFVAEQSGLFWSSIGILIALVLGFTVKSMMAPQKIKMRIDEAAKNIHRDLQVSVGEASISLSEGVWPELAIHVQNVRFETQTECWGRAVAEVDEMKLPLRFFDLLSGVVRFDELKIGEVNLSVKSAITVCSDEASLESEVQGINEPSKSDAVKSKNQTRVKDSLIDEISVQRLRVTYLPLALTSFELSNLKMKVASHSPVELNIVSQVNLFGETLSGDYSSFGELRLSLLEKKKLDGDVSGIWREGEYKLSFATDLEKQRSEVKFEAQHLPLRQMFPLLRRYNLMHREFEPLQSWLSMKAELSGPVGEPSLWNGKIENLQLEGDLGVIEAQPIEIKSLSPVQTSSIDIQLKPLVMDSVVAMVNAGKKPKFLGGLGLLTGSARFNGPDDIELTGDYSGLEFLFSNRGVRKVQTISLMSGDLALKNNQWRLKLQRIRPLEGIFDGSVSLEADREWADVRMNADVREVVLSQEIQKLMTNGGHLGPMDGEFKVQMVGGVLKELQTEARWDDVLIEGLEVGRVFLKGRGGKDKMFFQVRTRDAKLLSDSAFLKSLDPQVHKVFADRTFESGNIELQWSAPQNWEWSQAKLKSGVLSVETQGQVSERGAVSGVVKMREASFNQRWKVDGSKDAPVWIKQ
ncbi:MAG: AsmA family protein [Proteobacteria bacterium]|jgi:hypothetical protein|nr:AsmA family protein [Pseudomonadota bacterium]